MKQDSLSELSDDESARLRDLHARWSAAREAKNYQAADALRAELAAWGCFPPDYQLWHPVNEAPEHRMQRAMVREGIPA